MKDSDLIEVYSPSEQKGYRVSLGELKEYFKPKKPGPKKNKEKEKEK